MAAVAIAFFGIFVAMTAPLLLLNSRGEDLGVQAQWHYFRVTGGLSSVLDNAPTYLTMAAVAAGRVGVPSDGQYLADLLVVDGGAARFAAISCGAVFMGCRAMLVMLPVFVATTFIFFPA
jgi:Na+/H+ antiporter NhaD/arsenite permease-like protein